MFYFWLLLASATANVETWTPRVFGERLDIEHAGRVVFSAKAVDIPELMQEPELPFTQAFMRDIDGDGQLDVIAYANVALNLHAVGGTRATVVYLKRGDTFVRA